MKCAVHIRLGYAEILLNITVANESGRTMNGTAVHAPSIARVSCLQRCMCSATGLCSVAAYYYLSIHTYTMSIFCTLKPWNDFELLDLLDSHLFTGYVFFLYRYINICRLTKIISFHCIFNHYYFHCRYLLG